MKNPLVKNLLDWASKWGCKQEMIYTLLTEYESLDNFRQPTFTELRNILRFTLRDIQGEPWEAEAKQELFSICFANEKVSKRVVKLLENLAKLILLGLAEAHSDNETEINSILEKLYQVSEDDIFKAVLLYNYTHGYRLYWQHSDTEEGVLYLNYDTATLRSIWLGVTYEKRS